MTRQRAAGATAYKRHRLYYSSSTKQEVAHQRFGAVGTDQQIAGCFSAVFETGCYPSFFAVLQLYGLEALVILIPYNKILLVLASCVKLVARVS